MTVRKRSSLLLVILGVCLVACGDAGSRDDKVARAEAAMERGAYGEAVVALRNLIESGSKEPSHTLLLARALFLKGDESAAEEALNEARRNSADPRDIAELQSQWLVAQGLFQRLLESVDAQPELSSDRRAYFRGRALQGLGRAHEALSVYHELLEKEPDSADLQLRIAQAHAHYGRVLLATEAVDRAISMSDQPGRVRVDSEAWLLKAALAKQEGDADEARASLARSIEAAPGQLSAVQFGRVLAEAVDGALRRGELKDARLHFEALSKALPQSLLTDMVGAQIRLVEGDQSSVAGDLQKLLQTYPDLVPARALLVAAHLRSGSIEQALKQASEVGESAQDASIPLNLQQLLRAAASEKAGGVERSILVSNALLRLSQFTLARMTLEDVLAANPVSVPARMALIRIDLEAGRASEALRMARVLSSDYPNDQGASVLLADALIANADFKDAESILEKLWSQNQSGSLAIALFQARLRANQPDASLVLRQWLKENPADVPPRVQLAAAMQQSGDERGAAIEYERVVALSPRNHLVRAVALNNLAIIYDSLGDSRALKTASAAYDAAKILPEIQDTYGWMLFRSGDTQEALPLLESAAAASPTSPTIRFHYAAALAKSGQAAIAAELLEDVLLDTTDFEGKSDAVKLLTTARRAK